MSTKGGRQVHTKSCGRSILNFLLANPDEELTISDCCIKFDCTAQAVHGAITRFERDGIEYVKVIRLKSKGIAQ